MDPEYPTRATIVAQYRATRPLWCINDSQGLPPPPPESVHAFQLLEFRSLERCNFAIVTVAIPREPEGREGRDNFRQAWDPALSV